MYGPLFVKAYSPSLVLQRGGVSNLKKSFRNILLPTYVQNKDCHSFLEHTSIMPLYFKRGGCLRYRQERHTLENAITEQWNFQGNVIVLGFSGLITGAFVLLSPPTPWRMIIAMHFRDYLLQS